MVCAFGDPGQTIGRSTLTSLLLPFRYLELGVAAGNTADRWKGLSGYWPLFIAILESTLPCQRARHDAPIVIGGVTSGAYRLTCTDALFALLKIAWCAFSLVFFSVLCNSPLSGLNPYWDVQAVIYAPVRARWELTQTPSFMFGLFFAIFCFCLSIISSERSRSI